MEMLRAGESFSSDISCERADCAFSDWYCSFFPPFTKTGNKSVLEIKVSLAQLDHFRGALPSGIHEFK